MHFEESEKGFESAAVKANKTFRANTEDAQLGEATQTDAGAIESCEFSQLFEFPRKLRHLENHFSRNFCVSSAAARRRARDQRQLTAVY